MEAGKPCRWYLTNVIQQIPTVLTVQISREWCKVSDIVRTVSNRARCIWNIGVIYRYIGQGHIFSPHVSHNNICDMIMITTFPRSLRNALLTKYIFSLHITHQTITSYKKTIRKHILRHCFHFCTLQLKIQYVFQIRRETYDVSIIIGL